MAGSGSVPILNTAFKILLVTNVCFTAVKIHRDSGKLADFHSTKKEREKKEKEAWFIDVGPGKPNLYSK